MKQVKSGIPQGATEEPVHAQNREEGILRKDRIVDYFIKGNLVGRRAYNHEGILVIETPMRNGLKHGREITWGDDGKLLLIEPYVKGKIHGTARQYGRHGKVIGTYTMAHGTGLDVWRQENDDGTVFISEIHQLQDGFPNDFEWSFVSPKQDLWLEQNWRMGKLHGIQRMWNIKGRLRRGYPKFYIDDQVVSKQIYIKTTLIDKTLPVFRERDNSPNRKWSTKIKELFRS